MSRTASSAKLQLWRERLEQFAASQQTIQEFCREIGCSVAAYYYWQRKLSSLPGTSPDTAEKPASAFVPVVLRHGNAKPIVVHLKDGTRILVPADALAALGLVLQHAQRVAA